MVTFQMFRFFGFFVYSISITVFCHTFTVFFSLALLKPNSTIYSSFPSFIFFIIHYCTYVSQSKQKRFSKKTVEDKPEDATFDGTRRVVQLGYFIVLSVIISQQDHRPKCFFFCGFLKRLLKYDCFI